MIEKIFLGVNDIKKDLYAEKRGIGALVNRLKGGGCDIWKQRQSRIVYHKEERGKNNEWRGKKKKQARATKNIKMNEKQTKRGGCADMASAGECPQKTKRGKQNSEIEKGKDNKIWKGRTSARAVYQIFLHSGH